MAVAKEQIRQIISENNISSVADVYVKASTLIYELEQAQVTDEYLNYTKKLAALDLLVIDDFGLMELDIDKCRNLFEVIDSRD